jgi:hypothetical protein
MKLAEKAIWDVVEAVPGQRRAEVHLNQGVSWEPGCGEIGWRLSQDRLMCTSRFTVSLQSVRKKGTT